MRTYTSLASQRSILWLVLSLCVSGIAWLYAHRAGEGINPRGDLFSPWMGTRELLLHGRNPYSPEVSHEIQMAFYGRVIDQNYGQPGVSVINEQRFVYPVYVVFLLAPTVFVDFLRLQVWALIIFAMLTAISVLLWLDALPWHPSGTLVGAIILLVLSSPQIVQGLRLRQLGMLTGFLLALAAWCMVRNHLALAGILLAFSTIKPQMALLPLAWFLLWSLGEWRTRWPLPAGFGITLAVLGGLGEILLPGWPRYFLNGLAAYPKYFPVGSLSLLSLTLGNWAGGAISGVAIVGLSALAWRNRRVAARAEEFMRTLATFLIATTLIMPILTPFNQVLLLLPALMIVRSWNRLPLFGRSLFAVAVAWPWISSFGLLLFQPPLAPPNRITLLPPALILFMPFLLFSLHVAGRHSRNPISAAAPSLP